MWLNDNIKGCVYDNDDDHNEEYDPVVHAFYFGHLPTNLTRMKLGQLLLHVYFYHL